MLIVRKSATARALAGVMLFASLLTTAAFAAPPKKGAKKPPAKKPATDRALVAAGKKVFDGNGCAACHAIGGKGGNSAPDLTKVAADPKHTPKWLEESVVDPKADNPNSQMPPYKESIKGKDLKALVAYLATLKGEAPKNDKGK